MTEPCTPPAGENERSRRMARLEKLSQRFGDPFHLTQFAKTHAANEIKDKYDPLPAGEKTSDSVTVAGRIVAIRNNGMFIVILDDTNRLQIFHNLKRLPWPQGCRCALPPPRAGSRCDATHARNVTRTLQYDRRHPAIPL